MTKSRTPPKRPVVEYGVRRANLPGRYTCPQCGELLSGPPGLYCYCPGPLKVRAPMRRARAA